MEMATTMSSRGKKTEIKAEPFALAQKTSDLALRNSLTLAEMNNVYDKDKISAELKAKMDYHDYPLFYYYIIKNQLFYENISQIMPPIIK